MREPAILPLTRRPFEFKFWGPSPLPAIVFCWLHCNNQRAIAICCIAITYNSFPTHHSQRFCQRQHFWEPKTCSFSFHILYVWPQLITPELGTNSLQLLVEKLTFLLLQGLVVIEPVLPIITYVMAPLEVGLEYVPNSEVRRMRDSIF